MPIAKTRKNAGAVRVLRAKPLERLPWLAHGYSTRTGGVSKAFGRKGDLNLGFSKEDARAAVDENRSRFVAALVSEKGAAGRWPLVTLKQVHSDVIHRVDTVKS